jgi:hypothetical protein
LLPIDESVASTSQSVELVAALFGYVRPHGSDSVTALVHHSCEIVPSRSGRDGGATYGRGIAVDAPTRVVVSAQRRSVGTHCDALAVVVHQVSMFRPGGTARRVFDASVTPDVAHAADDLGGVGAFDSQPAGLVDGHEVRHRREHEERPDDDDHQGKDQGRALILAVGAVPIVADPLSSHPW